MSHRATQSPLVVESNRPRYCEFWIFLARNVGVNGEMRFVFFEEPVSSDGKQQFIPPLSPITLVRQLGANFRVVEYGFCYSVNRSFTMCHPLSL